MAYLCLSLPSSLLHKGILHIARTETLKEMLRKDPFILQLYS